MHSVRIDKVMNLVFSAFYRIGFWQRGNRPSAGELGTKLFYCIYFFLTMTLIAMEAFKSENFDDAIFQTEVATMGVVLGIKASTVVWKQKQIQELLGRLCVFSIRYDEDLNFFNNKLGRFMKFLTAFISAAAVMCIFCSAILPFVRDENQIFINFAFPLDYKNNDVSFWIASLFFFTEVIIGFFMVACSTVIWYLMFHCSARYDVLARAILKTGRYTGMGKMTETKNQQIFFRDLKTSIDDFLQLKGLIDEVGTFTADLFFIQFGTSGMCICASTYCLAFDVSDNSIELMCNIYLAFYTMSELFVITYLGNEIMLSSDRLMYTLFESDWGFQPQSTKKCIIIFAECLKQPHKLLIGKLYPLTLETFTRILNSAYSMFNILQNAKK